MEVLVDTLAYRSRARGGVLRIFDALFPPASITGAPKPRTTEIIRELETTPRRVYTGTVGYVAPGRVAQFNVAIRTVLVDRESGHVEDGNGVSRQAPLFLGWQVQAGHLTHADRHVAEDRRLAWRRSNVGARQPSLVVLPGVLPEVLVQGRPAAVERLPDVVPGEGHDLHGVLNFPAGASVQRRRGQARVPPSGP